MTRTISAAQARRIAIAAQGLAAPKPDKPVTARAFRALAGRLGALQLDSVNVFARTHYMPTFSRLGPYDPAILEREAWGRRRSLFEYWGHAASLLPLELQPLMRWKMDRARDGRGKTWLGSFGEDRRGFIDEVLAEIGRRDGVTGADFASDGPRKSGWWEWSDGKRALEWLFWIGRITTKTRRGFERVYDLTERVIPAEILAQPTPSEADAQRELVRRSAEAMGIATIGDLTDYFRIGLQADAKARALELVEAGVLEAVTVPGWRSPVYLHVGAKLPRRVSGAALLSPFDNLIWRRERTERMFGVRYRIGLYTPADQRTHGYYVYPFLLGDRLAAQVDLKSDRQAGALLVQAAHLEAGAAADQVLGPLAAELRAAAAWQGLADVRIAKKGGLAAALSREFG
ncbi:MAG TPA: crosslink repair DNA glycosylase YcaQ family protein [Caulobacteraceae bacterium]|nr:crosslink repair DNA glycosylase YcaQ family protein [Caulobacteraceae bacterium]